MTRWELEIEANRKYGSTIGWLANVINCHHRKPLAKIKKLISLAKDERITSCSFSMDHVLVDGKAIKLSGLDTYNEPMPEGWKD